MADLEETTSLLTRTEAEVEKVEIVVLGSKPDAKENGNKPEEKNESKPPTGEMKKGTSKKDVDDVGVPKDWDPNSQDAKTTTGICLDLIWLPFEDLAKRVESRFNFQDLKTSPGLSNEEVQTRLKRDGLNQLTPPKKTPTWLKYLLFYIDPFLILLVMASGLCFLGYGLLPTAVSLLYIGCVLIFAVVLSATLAFFLEGQAKDAMAAFSSMVPASATAVRGGVREKVDVTSLVVGDIVVVKGGDKVPADMRVLYAGGAKVEKSSLTGESLPVSASSQGVFVLRQEDAKNIVFNTSKCMEGEIIGVVISTGDRTLIGSIASMVTKVESGLTVIQVEIKRFVIRLAAVAFVLGITFMIIGFARGKSWQDAVINSFIVVMIAVVPEGLPVTVVMCLNVTCNEMKAKAVYVKQLSSVETLGSITAIASDKTGTLTQNKMTVSKLWWGSNIPLHSDAVSSSFNFQIPTLVPSALLSGGKKMYGRQSQQAGYNILELCAILCNETQYSDEKKLTETEALSRDRSVILKDFDQDVNTSFIVKQFSTVMKGMLGLEMDEIKKLGTKNGAVQRDILEVNATDTALFNYVASRISVELLRYHNPVVHRLAFNSTNKFAITIVKPHEVKQRTGKDAPLYHNRRVFMKGAPEIILEKCATYMDGDKEIPIDDDFREEFTANYKAFAKKGERVIGFAFKELPLEEYTPDMDEEYNIELKNFPTTGLCFVGLISLIDPPKTRVPNAVKECRAAGIKVYMVTGDGVLTAAAIAELVNIKTQPTREEVTDQRLHDGDETPVEESDFGAYVIEGTQINKFEQDDWDRILKKEVVFARTTPEQKLKIVEQLQMKGECVAVTGDGVNDSPALKRADVGVAMGIMGSEVAKDAAHIILTNDDFASIVDGVKSGRTIFDNLSKTIAYTLTHMVPETVPTLLTIAFDLPPALPALSVLAIDLGTELCPAISFAHEVSEGDVMSRMPRKRTDRLVSGKATLYFTMQGIICTMFSYMGYLLVFNHYRIPYSALPWTAQHWVTGAPQFHVGGPAGCSMGTNSPNYTGDCISYNDSEQVEIAAQANAAYFYMLTGFQVFHVFMCKTRIASVFNHPFWANNAMVLGVVIEIFMIILFIFIPVINVILVGKPFYGPIFALPFTAWLYLLIVCELRKKLTRDHQEPTTRFGKFVQNVLSW